MIEQLAALLLPIDALLFQTNFYPHVNPSTEITDLFRNMWFLCVLFHFTDREGRENTVMEWQVAALARIASKTPKIVLEDIHDAVSELEYNTVIRHDYVHSASIFASNVYFNMYLLICFVCRLCLNIVHFLFDTYQFGRARSVLCHQDKLYFC